MSNFIFYQQLGAPALIYCPEIDADDADADNNNANNDFLSVPPRQYPFVHGPTIENLLQKSNRMKFRWNTTSITNSSNLDVEQANKQKRSNKRRGRRRRSSSNNNKQKQKKKKTRKVRIFEESMMDPTVTQLEKSQLNLLLGSQTMYFKDCRRLVSTYSENRNNTRFTEGVLKKNFFRNEQLCWAIKTHRDHDDSRNFAILNDVIKNPSYMAPFGHQTLRECEEDNHTAAGTKPAIHNLPPPRHPQGNCLLSFPCPCPPCCSSEKRDGCKNWCLIHPVGPLLDTIVVSNIMFPRRDIICAISGGKNSTFDKNTTKSTSTSKPKRIHKKIEDNISSHKLCLADTILDIQQCGSWLNNHTSTFVARTGTHVSVFEMEVADNDSNNSKMGDGSCRSMAACWGDYKLKEIERLDQRSLCRGIPSYHPISLAVHPKYGNEIVGPKFAFVSHSKNEQNVIHDCVFSAGNFDSEAAASINKHSIPSLREISLIDYTSNQPMCLWSAARSYVTPTPPQQQGRGRQLPYFGTGSSLYTIDLRSDTAMFQWSPSAQEMVTEGVHSINAILTDWDNPNRVFVSSKSALKTWEIDARMPYRALNVWSLTNNCEDSETTINATNNKELHGEPSLLIKVQRRRQQQNRYNNNNNNENTLSSLSPIIQINTDPGTYGFHIYQRPQNRPRFQSDSLECIMTPGLLDSSNNDSSNSLLDSASIAASSMFVLPENSHDIYTCGISSLRIPLSRFLSDDDLQELLNFDGDYSNDKERGSSNVLCTLTMNNGGDIYCHSLYESSSSNDHMLKKSKQVENLPIGTTIIEIPPSLHGKVWDDPTGDGGRDGNKNNSLGLFLTNQYPTPRDALTAQEEGRNNTTYTKFVRIRLKRQQETNMEEEDEKRSAVPFFMPPLSKPDIRIYEDPECPRVLTREEDEPDRATLMMPSSLVKEATDRLVFNQEGDDDVDDENEDVALGETRSDLSMSMLSRVSKAWDAM